MKLSAVHTGLAFDENLEYLASEIYGSLSNIGIKVEKSEKLSVTGSVQVSGQAENGKQVDISVLLNPVESVEVHYREPVDSSMMPGTVLQQAIFGILVDEREYQIEKWGTRGHEVGAWVGLIQQYVTEAMTGWAHNNNDEVALDKLRKVAALCLACFEQHGTVPRRRPLYDGCNASPFDSGGSCLQEAQGETITASKGIGTVAYYVKELSEAQQCDAEAFNAALVLFMQQNPGLAKLVKGRTS